MISTNHLLILPSINILRKRQQNVNVHRFAKKPQHVRRQKDSIQKFIDESKVTSGRVHLLIFHCEFSSERGPKMYRFLRSLDRTINKGNYPRLNFPEVYLLEGGYKAFYQKYDTLCEPQAFLPMLHENHGKDLRHFRVKSKSWTAGDKPRPRFRAENLGKKIF